MKIEPLTNGSLRVWLSEEELSRWEIDSEGPGQRRAIRRLLRHIFLQTEQYPSARLTAELIPVEGGGVLLVSPAVHTRLDGPAVYHIADDDSLIALIGQWRRMPSAGVQLCLYEQGRGYDLAVYPAQPLTRRQQRLLSEYGTLLGLGEGVAAHCSEYGQLVATGSFTEPAPQPPEPAGQVH